MDITSDIANGTIIVSIDGTETIYTKRVDFEADYPGRKDWNALEESMQNMANYVPPVPTIITKIQAMRAMKQTLRGEPIVSLWEDFKAVLALNEDARDEWELAQELDRNNPFVAQLAPVLGLSDTDLDNLFILGSTL